MAVAPLPVLRIPTLSQAQPFVDKDGRLTNEALRRLNEILGGLTRQGNATAEAINAANLAAAAAELAKDAADMAQAAADQAQSSGNVTSSELALQNSYISPASVLTATPTTITIANHTRFYADGTSAPVTGATIAATGPGQTDYIYYDQPSRAGGTVSYQVSTTQPIQSGDRHVVGAVMIPTAGTANGGRGPQAPGYVVAEP